MRVAVYGVAPLQQAMFMTLALAYLIVIDTLGRLATRASPAHDMSFSITG